MSNITSSGKSPGEGKTIMSTELSPEALRSQIRQRISAIEIEQRRLAEERLQLNKAWNSSLPVSQLPNELLVSIFLYYADNAVVDPPRLLVADMGQANLGWMELLPVCRHWYDVACSTPTLWRTIYLRSQIRWTELALARSAPATIDVSVCFHRSTTAQLALLHPHVDRIRRLRFDFVSHAKWMPAVTSLLGNAMLVLETLVLPQTIGGHTPDSTDLKLSSERFPSLRSLLLTQTVAPRDPLVYARLHTLSLLMCACEFSFDQFLDMLSSSTVLEELVLNGVLQRLSDGRTVAAAPVPRRPPLRLPRLSSLVLAGHDPKVTSMFLAHLLLEHVPHVDIKAGQDIDRYGRVPETAIPSILPPNHAIVLPALAAATRVSVIVMDTRYSLRCFTKPATEEEFISLSLEATPAPLVAIAIETLSLGLKDAVWIFAASPVTTLDVRGNSDHVYPIEWRRVFDAFPLLESLSVDEGSLEDFVEGLSLTTTTAHDDARPAACPGLRSLKVKGRGSEAFFEMLLDCVRARAERGAYLETLELAIADAAYMMLDENEGYLPLFRGLVGNVIYEVPKMQRSRRKRLRG